MAETKKLEFWADSFHEGNWACEELSKFWELVEVKYELGFIPVFTYKIDSNTNLEVTVLGSYKNWDPLPKIIDELIEWGKPDLIAYDPENEEIIFAVEETAAVPTGNQALQRCERIYGSLRMKIPFWYLLGEFGVHVDGGVRRDSIWPTVLGIKLSCIERTPCMVLHYSDLDHPEDYSAGSGVESLYKALSTQIEVYLGKKDKADLTPILTDQFSHMLDFIKSQGSNLVSYMPESEELYSTDMPARLAKFVTGEADEDVLPELFNWGVTTELPEEIYENISKGGLIKPDVLITQVEELVEKKVAYNLSGNAGSRPQDKSKVSEWIAEQKVIFGNNKTDAEFSIEVSDFPVSDSGRLHVTTAKNVFYLIDSTKDLEESIKCSFDRLSDLSLVNTDLPALLYISNSLKPGRIFGDPFTGQLSAFANVFTKNITGEKTRNLVAYYPHQVHTQLFNLRGEFRKNKGIILMRELLDYAVFQGGVLVDMKSGKII